MTQSMIGYHASHEQCAPSQLLHHVCKAEQAGFTAAMCSDHFAPWSERQGESGFAWSWLGAALQASRLSYGMVCAPGQRYHPTIVAQASATLAEMFPDRLWCAFGSGQLVNEHITGGGWINKFERNERLRQCVDVIRALWAGETVSFHSNYLHVDEARLYTRPAKPPLLLAAAVTPETAEWAGGWADGIITIYKPPAKQREFIKHFRRGGGEGKPMFLQAQVSYASTDEQALLLAHQQWRNNILPNTVLTELRMPSQFDELGKLVSPEDLLGSVRVSSDWARHVAWLEEDIEHGFERIFVHNVNLEEDRFLDVFGEKVLPALGDAIAKPRVES